MKPLNSRMSIRVVLLTALTSIPAVAQLDSNREAGGSDDSIGYVTGLESKSAVGPDLVVISLPRITSYGSEFDLATGRWISAFGVGTTSCNRGDDPAVWLNSTNQHPVRARNVYRLHNGRFEQIGMSWLEHAFYAVTGNQCGQCIPPPGISGQHLGVNCSTPTSSNIAGTRSNLGPRSDVNAFTGYFPYPFNRTYKDDKIDRRLQVYTDDLDPDLNPGALYFVEGQYVTPDEAAAGNHFNNASYRPVLVGRPGLSDNFCNNPVLDPDIDFCIDTTSFTVVEQPAIKAWKTNDPGVVETEVRVPGEGMFILAAKATNLEEGYWHYEYALYNMNSHRSAGGFVVPVRKDSLVNETGFHAPFYHSGEPYDAQPWSLVRKAGRIAWRTTPFEQNPDANALRWSTLYNFRFASDEPPGMTRVEIELFRPGEPRSVVVETVGPKLRRTPTRQHKR